MSVSRALGLVGVSLLAVALVPLGFLRARRRELVGAAVVLVVAGIHAVTAPRVGGALVCHRSSAYGDIRVLDYGPDRFFMSNAACEGQVDRETGNSILFYNYVLMSRLLLAHPDAKRALVIGLGVGLQARELERRGIETDVVEIDPAVADVAREFFGFALSRGKLYIEDARTFIAAPPTHGYDLVIVDAFQGERLPLDLLTVESFRDIREKVLAPDGVMGVNLLGFGDGKLTPGAAALHRTIAREFPSVVAFPVLEEGEAAGNVEILASCRPLEARATEVQMSTFPKGQMRGFHWDGIFQVPSTPGPVLTDDENPYDALDREDALRLRSRINEAYPADLRPIMLID
jgi:spermidine synthase